VAAEKTATDPKRGVDAKKVQQNLAQAQRFQLLFVTPLSALLNCCGCPGLQVLKLQWQEEEHQQFW
jgi:hypothetical protein